MNLQTKDIDGKYTLICADCLEFLKIMKDGDVDVTFTSPPYNDSGKTKSDIENKRHVKYENIENRDDWFEWQCNVIDELLRVTKRHVLYNVQAILNNKADVYRLIGKYADKIDQILVWYKPNAQPQHYPHRIANFYEMVLVFRGRNFDKLYINSNGYTNVIVQNINADHSWSEKHRAVMSKPFADEIIREFTMPNELVFDPFMGLATTGVCCAEQGRRFIGTEIYKPYFDIACERMEGVTRQHSFFDMETDEKKQFSLWEGNDGVCNDSTA